MIDENFMNITDKLNCAVENVVNIGVNDNFGDSEYDIC